ncbi:HD domain-containing phosphohydrolase [Vibrio sp. NTOU-M3]|uniref:HD-GYP domain-containing protein n=1 Tax=Vibrio sp. NTOU-M3 TaxID=3234954 RepID=UPI00349F5746
MSECLNDVGVDLHQVLIGIAKALDSVGLDEIHHGHRVGYMAYCCAKRMGWPEEISQVALAVGLIHDCGVSQQSERSELLTHLISSDSHLHCLRGYERLIECKPLQSLALPVFHHHTWWQELREMSAVSEQNKQLAALVFVADRVDYLYARMEPDNYGNITPTAKQAIIQELTQNTHTLFEPNTVQHMCELVDNDEFWFAMKREYIEVMISQLAPFPFFDAHLTLEDTIQLAELSAKIIDAKSSFTFDHSFHVARLSEYLGYKMGYSETMQRMLYLAGLVHDIGKLDTPVSILHKSSELTDAEYACIKRHSTDTRYALQAMLKSEQIIEWASNHHERLDGSGYPAGKHASQLDKPSRIIAVADVFQALTQSRPYRHGLDLNEVLNLVYELVEDNKLDREVYECIASNAAACYRISTGEEPIQQSA